MQLVDGQRGLLIVVHGHGEGLGAVGLHVVADVEQVRAGAEVGIVGVGQDVVLIVVVGAHFGTVGHARVKGFLVLQGMRTVAEAVRHVASVSFHEGLAVGLVAFRIQPHIGVILGDHVAADQAHGVGAVGSGAAPQVHAQQVGVERVQILHDRHDLAFFHICL